jgi:hypothetical protein
MVTPGALRSAAFATTPAGSKCSVALTSRSYVIACPCSWNDGLHENTARPRDGKVGADSQNGIG